MPRLASLKDWLKPQVVFREQFAYGHREILVEYSGAPADCIFRGRIQHGYDPLGTEPVKAFNPFPFRRAYQWVWSAEVATKAKREGIQRVSAIGAPWLYLLDMRERPTVSKDSYLLLIPGHYNELATSAFHQRFADEARRTFGQCKMRALLHGFDFMCADFRSLYLKRGIEVTTAGWPTVATPPRDPGEAVGDRLNFLPNLLQEMAGAEAVVTDGMGTHVLYATTLGVTVVVMPQTLDFLNVGYPGEGTVSPATAQGIDSHRRHRAWQDSVLGEHFRGDIPTKKAVQLAERYLGTSAFCTPTELASKLHWFDAAE